MEKLLQTAAVTAGSRRVQTQQLLPQSAAGFGLTELTGLVSASFPAWWLVAPTKQQRPASRTAGTALSNYTAPFIT